MAVPRSAVELLTWSVTLLIPVLAALLVPVSAPSRRTRRWLSVAQAVGMMLIVTGLIISLVMFPVVLLVMFCAIFSNLVQILTAFTSGFRCPGLPIGSDGGVLIQLGVALLLFATVRRWRLAR
jgi:hypothetical protein